MKAILTGATGYIGGVLYKHLKAFGWSVGLICRPSSTITLADGDCRFNYDGSYNSVAVAIKDFKPDVVFHLASSVVIEHTHEQVLDLIEANITFPTFLLEAMDEYNVKRIVSTGSYSQHFTAEDTYCPANLYAATKQAFTDICAYYVDARKFQVTELRLFDVYGPNDPRGKLLPLIQKVVTGELTSLAMSPGEQELDFIHVSDVADAFIASANRLMKHTEPILEVYGVGTGTVISLKDLVARISKLLRRRLPITFGGRPYREREVMKSWRNYDSPPGWRPKYDLDSGLAEIFITKL